MFVSKGLLKNMGRLLVQLELWLFLGYIFMFTSDSK